jgi:hypothetical protein
MGLAKVGKKQALLLDPSISHHHSTLPVSAHIITSIRCGSSICWSKYFRAHSECSGPRSGRALAPLAPPLPPAGSPRYVHQLATATAISASMHLQCIWISPMASGNTLGAMMGIDWSFFEAVSRCPEAPRLFQGQSANMDFFAL